MKTDKANVLEETVAYLNYIKDILGSRIVVIDKVWIRLRAYDFSFFFNFNMVSEIYTVTILGKNLNMFRASFRRNSGSTIKPLFQ